MKRPFKICIVSHAHLTNNPRVYKEAVALSKAGYDVSIVTLLINSELYNSDINLLNGYNINYSNSVNLINSNGVAMIYAKAIRKSAQMLSRYFKIELPQSLSYNISDLLYHAENENADLYIGHNEPGLWVGVQLLKKNKNVAFDFEDWYSRDYLVPGRAVKLLSQLENEALRKAKYVSTTSEALARKLTEINNCDKPVVIYNVFPVSDPDKINNKQDDKDALSLYWFSQSIGPGRGIEQIVEAINLVSVPVEIHLRGNIPETYKQKLYSFLKSDIHRLFFHLPVSPNQLIETMQNYDLGLSLELKNPLSRNLTVTNKILHYLAGGLPVLASDTEGQKEISELSKGAVTLIDLYETESVADMITAIASDRKLLLNMRKKVSEVAAERFNWKVHEKKLLLCVEKALLN